MHKHDLSKRILSALLALAMFAGVTLTASADTMVIDGSGFTDPTITKGTIYYWHKGMPPWDLDGTSYPVIIAWDDKYYLAADSTFYNEIVGSNKTKHAEDLVDPKVRSTGSMMDVRWSQETDGTPAGLYHKDREYSAHPVSELPFDYSTLKSTGNAVSLGAPALPRFVAVDLPPSTDANYLFNNNQDVTLDTWKQCAYAIWFPNPTTGSTQDQYKNWLTATHRIYSYYNEMDATFGTEAHYVNNLDWYLDTMKKTQADFTNPGVTYTPSLNGLNSRGYEARPAKDDLEARTWQVNQIYDTDKYLIRTRTCSAADLRSFYASNGRGPLINYVDNMHDWGGQLALMHTGDKLLSAGLGGGAVTKGWTAILPAFIVSPEALIQAILDGKFKVYSRDDRFEDRKDFMNAQPGFDLYWGEPATISFCQLDFTVQKGQVQTFDGPIAIGHDATITVEDGGVLACSDWIINNGTIVVKPGGTLLLQSYETANDQTRYGVISSMEDAAGDDGGRIYCDGTIIVMPDCKLCCSGKYGLSLGEGSQVVNYGAIISENFSVSQGYTIENRGDTSYVFPGWGLSGSGSTFLTQKISGDNYPGKSAVEASAAVNLPSNAVYGKGASRTVRNTAGTIAYTTAAKSGGVTSNVPKLPPLPSGGGGEGGGGGGGTSGVQYFILPGDTYYTVFYPDTGEDVMNSKVDTTFVLYADPEKESYMYYEYQRTDGNWETVKKVLDTNRQAQVYKGIYNLIVGDVKSKLIYEGLLKDWDGSDMDYFTPPQTEETPLIEGLLGDSYTIRYDGYKNVTDTPDEYVSGGPKSRIVMYEKGESALYIYNVAVEDYNKKTVLRTSEHVKIYRTWIDKSFYIIREELIYDGILKDWTPSTLISE